MAQTSLPARVAAYTPAMLPALRDLINLHVGAAVPGWAVTAGAVAAHLERDLGEYVVDRWVAERAALVAGDAYRLHAAAHLLRYRDAPEVSKDYRHAGAIAWVVGRPNKPAALAGVLAASTERFAAWGVREAYGWDTGLPVPALAGVADAWPHVAAGLRAAGFTLGDGEPSEALYGGRLDGVPEPGPPPLPGLTVRRMTGLWGTRFAAVLDGREIAWCEGVADLTNGGEQPALRGWAELDEVKTDEGWRNQGVGTWLVRHAVAWLRLAGCDRIVFTVGADDEARGAGRFYRRFGWDVFVRETRSWRLARAAGGGGQAEARAGQ
ncbi:MAG: GNAT family N-acetyltransferase [Chloroflexota bacterium]